MKTLITILLFTVATLGAAEPEAKSPSELRNRTEPLPTIRFISFWLDDMRLLFCPEDVLQERIKKSVCVLDNSASFQEIAIDSNQTVESVLKYARTEIPEHWQVRLVAQNSITQTPVVGSTKEDRAAFLKTRVMPGDFVIITMAR